MKNLIKTTFISICSLLTFTASLTLQGQTVTQLQAEIDAIETGAGLEDDGSYTADATTNYLTGATSLKDADKALDTALQAESTSRTNADTQLQNNINTVASASDTADTAMQADIDQNELDSDAADTQLQNNINAESTARIDADALLRTDIDNSLANIDLNRADISRNTSDIQRNREGIAMVAAMTHTTLLPGNDVALDIGIANFESETAYSINFARRVKEGVQVNLSAASTSGLSDAVVRGSIGFQW